MATLKISHILLKKVRNETLDTLNPTTFKALIHNLSEEIADTIITVSNIFPNSDIEEEIKRVKNIKLIRLKNRLE